MNTNKGEEECLSPTQDFPNLHLCLKLSPLPIKKLSLRMIKNKQNPQSRVQNQQLLSLKLSHSQPISSVTPHSPVFYPVSMQSHFCKLCFKTFPNGSSLGGHMRSHLLSLPVPVKDGFPTGRTEDRRHESASSVTLMEKKEDGRAGEEEEGRMGLRFQNYGLRENPRRSIHVADLEFESEDYEDGTASLLLQDRESETESSKNLTRQRSKRVRKSFPPREQNLRSLSKNEKLSWVKAGDLSEPASSISEETSKEDIAFCLMLMSRDRWKKKTGIIKNHRDEKDFGEEEDDRTKKVESFEDTSEFEDGLEVKSESAKKVKRDRGKYRCEPCNKVFRSYQAFGGHQASHNKTRLGIPTTTRVAQHKESTNNNVGGSCNNKVHECPFCDRVFTSGQALGGHKRSHASRSDYSKLSLRMTTITARSGPIHARGTIDLNMPAPADDELSRLEIGG